MIVTGETRDHDTASGLTGNKVTIDQVASHCDPARYYAVNKAFKVRSTVGFGGWYTLHTPVYTIRFKFVILVRVYTAVKSRKVHSLYPGVARTPSRWYDAGMLWWWVKEKGVS